jgi:hypothetical protein
MLTKEVVERAKELCQAFVLLKVDVIKAPDKLEWRYMIQLVEHIGMGERFVGNFQEITRNANSVVILHGRGTAAFEITRSVQQGCPISPLFFDLSLEGLSCSINFSLERNAIRGVPIEGDDLIL